MKKEIIGICTWTLGISDLNEMMGKIASLGLNGVQYCNHPTDYAASDVISTAKQYGLELIIFDPFDCRPGDRNGKATLDNAISFYCRAIDYAAELGCGLTLQGLSTWTENCLNHEDAWNFLIEALQAISSYAKDKKVPLAYEPCNLYEVPFIHTAEEYQRLIDNSGCNDVQVLLDSFHMNIGEQDPLRTLKTYAQRNAVYHISDSNREGIGYGNIDFASQYRALKSSGYNGPYAVEFVLKNNPTNTPPRNDIEMAEMSRQIRETVEIWRRFAQLN